VESHWWVVQGTLLPMCTLEDPNLPLKMVSHHTNMKLCYCRYTMSCVELVILKISLRINRLSNLYDRSELVTLKISLRINNSPNLHNWSELVTLKFLYGKTTRWTSMIGLSLLLKIFYEGASRQTSMIGSSLLLAFFLRMSSSLVLYDQSELVT